MIVYGTRPEIIKMMPVIKHLQRDRHLEVVTVHSGQHYDFEMSKIFIADLDLPEPDLNLNVRSGSAPQQISQTIAGIERAFHRFNPDIVLAEGDTNTVAATALAATALQIPFGHVESGLRSFDETMPEERNRIIADHCARLCFAPTVRAATNLCLEGIEPSRIFVTGNTVVDSCRMYLKLAKIQSTIVSSLGLSDGTRPIVTVTAHRRENVDNHKTLSRIVSALIDFQEAKIVFPVHPRTRKSLKKFGMWKKLARVPHIKLIPPLGYIDFLALLANSRVVITDSGGVQEEAATLGVRCVTIRTNTERPETVEMGFNVIAGTEMKRIISLLKEAVASPGNSSLGSEISNPLGDGRAGARIARILLNKLKESLAPTSPSYFRSGSAFFSLASITTSAPTTVSALQRKVEGVAVGLVYDKSGKPLFPSLDLKLRRGWRVLLKGEPSSLEMFRDNRCSA